MRARFDNLRGGGILFGDTPMRLTNFHLVALTSLCALGAYTPRARADAGPPQQEPAPPTVQPPPPRMPRPPGPPPSAERGSFDVQFEPNDPDVSLLNESGMVPAVYGYRYRGWGWRRRGWFAGYAPAFERVCTGPCPARFAPGEYHMALARGGRLVPVEGPVVLSGPSVLHARYEDRSGLRVAGAIIGIGGVIAGTIMIAESFHEHDFCDPNGFCERQGSTDGALLAGGIITIVGSAIVGSVLAWQRDEASITVMPLRVSSMEWRPGKSLASAPQGLALSVTF